METSRNVDGSGHEGEEKDQKGKKRSPATAGIESRRVVNGWDAKESHNENQDSPEVPALPEAKEPKQEKNSRHKERRIVMQPRGEGTKNMTAIKLSNRDKVQRG